MDLKTYLARHPEIFVGLKKGCIINYRVEGNKFHVKIGDVVEVADGLAENAALEIRVSRSAERRLVEVSPEDYPRVFGELFLSPQGDSWIEIELMKPMEELLEKGYGEWARKAGVM